MKRTLYVLSLSLAASLAATACKGESSTRSTYTPDPGTPRYSAPAPGQRQPGTSSVGTARAGTPAAARTTTAPRYNPYVPPTPAPYTPPATARTVPTPPPMPATRSLPTSGAFRWASSLREAQDAARASGRMVFIETGRPSCGNCQGLRNDVIPNPAINAELGAMVVGYYVDCDQEPNSQAYQLLVQNLPGAAMLPLVGFFTPDLRWVHGYSGGRNVARFRQEIATARAAYQRLASVEGPVSPVRTAALPTRSLGSLPDEELADVSRELADDRMLDAVADAPGERALATAPGTPAEAPVLAEVAAAAAAAEASSLAAAQAREAAALAASREAARLELEAQATAAAEKALAAERALAAEQALAAERAEAERAAAEERERAALAAALAAAPDTEGTAIVSPRAAPIFMPEGSLRPEAGAAAPPSLPAAEAPAAIAAAPATATPAVAPEAALAPMGATDVRAWAQTELRRAAAALSSRDYASARAILASVREKAVGAPEAREAAKGDVAIWNLRKIERAGTPDDAVRLRARAKADLEATVFEALFA